MFICDDSQTYVPAQVKHAGGSEREIPDDSSDRVGVPQWFSRTDPGRDETFICNEAQTFILTRAKSSGLIRAEFPCIQQRT